MCVVGPEVAGAAAINASLAISAATTAASVGMGLMSAQQQSQQAQAQMNMQARQQQLQQQQQRQSMIQQQEMQRQSMLQSQQQAYQSQVLQQRQAQDQYNLQVLQSNVQIQNQYNQQRAAVEQERHNIQRKYEADRIAFQRRQEEADQQIKYNNEAANKVYEQEQSKMTEAKKKAAFAQQAALAKAIGSKGAILSAGRTGQSVGLLINDAERQSGFAQAQADAQLASTMEQSQISMDQAFLQSIGANNQAKSRVGMAPTDPYMPAFPGIPNFVDPYQSEQEPAFGAA